MENESTSSPLRHRKESFVATHAESETPLIIKSGYVSMCVQVVSYR
jgi:hypothetical protein